MQAKQKGYTIIEVLLFLAISAALFTMSVIGMNGQVGRSRFKQNMETIQAKIVSVLDSVDKGYTLSDGNMGCIAAGNTLTLNNNGTTAGSNCVYYGRDIDVCTNNNQFNVSTYLANNKIINDPDIYTAQKMAALGTTIFLPSGVIFSPSTSSDQTTKCHVAVLHQSSNDNYQKVPRFVADRVLAATDNPGWVMISDTTPVKWCFVDGVGSSNRASITISQINVYLDMGDATCS